MMDESAVQAVRMVVFVGVVVAVVRSFLPYPGLKDKALYFEFCDLRRELMGMVSEGKISVGSKSFEFFMKYVSDIIHYSDDYNFSTNTFIKSTLQDNRNLAKRAFVKSLLADLEKQSPEAKEFAVKLFHLIARAFDKNPVVWLIMRVGFLFWLFESRKPESSYTAAAEAAKSVSSEMAVAV